MIEPGPRIIAWEITRSCNLKCRHCRASASPGPYTGELSTEECINIVDAILEIGRPILILTGGEPLLRDDIFEIASYATGKGLRTVMAPNGTLLTREKADKMKASGISRISVSIDFPTADLHDDFRGEPGAFEGAVEGIRNAREAGIEVQINSTITALNVDYLPELIRMAVEQKAVAFHPFLLVPAGRGREMREQELSPVEYERTLHRIYDLQQQNPGIFFKPTDVPHYMRIVKQRGGAAAHGHPSASQAVQGAQGCPHGGGMESMTRGCLGGTGFCFISHVGDVQPCGYFEVKAGNVREMTLGEIWKSSKLFQELRDFSLLKGKCGICEYREICGGCRARAYETTGDYMAEEPYCIYRPKGTAGGKG